MHTINNKKQIGAKGFTLIEMSIVITIVGLIIASTATAYVQWQEWKRFNTTKTNVENAKSTIESYLNMNGHYPCPASLSAVRGDLNNTNSNLDYGLETTGAGADCKSVAAGNINLASTTGIDVYVAPGARPIPLGYIDNTGTQTLPNTTPQIRIGTIPFRSLGLDEKQGYDGYGHRLFYAVTEHMTRSAGFANGTSGAIEVEDGVGGTYTNGQNNIHFVVFSAGKNGIGGFDQYGIQTPCTAGNESQNCDLINATFRAANFSTSANVIDGFDDIIEFGRVEIPLWESPEGGNEDDGVSKYANVGIGSVAKDNPLEELDVTGTIHLADDPSTAIQEGAVEANILCRKDMPNDPDCFNVSAIAGDLNALPTPTGGMKCPGANQYIIGIQNNQPICGLIDVGCTGSNVIKGVHSNGTFDCNAPPAAGCASQNILLCTETKTITAGNNGDTRTITAGTNVGNMKTQKFQCNNGSWNKISDTGLCTCTPSTPYNTTTTCATSSWPCGTRFTGTQQVQIQGTTCPSGNSSTTVIDNSGCTCIASSRTQNKACNNNSNVNTYMPAGQKPPAGYKFSSGNIVIKNTHDCTTKTCSGWLYNSDNCSCTNGPVTTTTTACLPNYTGSIVTTSQFLCQHGGGLGDYGQTTTTVTNTCACNVGTVAGTTRYCNAGYEPKASNAYGGVRTQTVTTLSGTTCNTATSDVDVHDNVCQPKVVPLTCSWVLVNPSTPIGGGGSPRVAGMDCTPQCGQTAKTCRSGSTLFSQGCDCQTN